MSTNGIGNVRTLPPVVVGGKVLKSTDAGGSEWDDESGGTPYVLPARLGETPAPIGNFDVTTTPTGWYWFDTSTPGTRPGSMAYGYVQVYSWPGVFSTWQIAYEHGSDLIMGRSIGQPWVKISPIDDSNLPGRLASVAPNATDANSCTKNGWYSTTPITANLPVAEYGVLLVNNITYEGAGRQVWFRHNAMEIWHRPWVIGPPIPTSGGWAWEKMYPIADAGLPARIQSANGPNQVNDFNLCTESGWYNAIAGAANAPTPTEHYHVEVIAFSSTIIRQFAHYLYGTATYTRANGGGGWTGWVQVFPLAATVPVRIEKQTADGIGASVTDWNNALENGWYQAPPGSANAPTANWFLGEVISHRAAGAGGLWISQEVWEFANNPADRWRRSCNAGSWTAWNKVEGGGGTTFPASPFHGQKFTYYYDALTTWKFEWRSDLGYWMFVGGSPMFAEQTSLVTTNSGNWDDLGGPYVYPPFTGEYMVSWGCKADINGNASGSSQAQMGISLNGGSVADEVTQRNSDLVSVARTMMKSLAAGTLAGVYRDTSASLTTRFTNRWISLTPIRKT